MNDRFFFLQKRKGLSSEYKKKASKDITTLCEKLIYHRNAKIVALFCATLQEPSIINLINIFKNDNTITFCCPKIVSQTEMKMLQISKNNLTVGTFGIKEPSVGSEIYPENIDLIFVPAVAIDQKGNRIGMGKGYYDRYLKKCTKAYKGGVIFKEQYSEKIFITNSWDIPVDSIIKN